MPYPRILYLFTCSPGCCFSALHICFGAACHALVTWSHLWPPGCFHLELQSGWALVCCTPSTWSSWHWPSIQSWEIQFQLCLLVPGFAKSLQTTMSCHQWSPGLQYMTHVYIYIYIYIYSGIAHKPNIHYERALTIQRQWCTQYISSHTYHCIISYKVINITYMMTFVKTLC